MLHNFEKNRRPAIFFLKPLFSNNGHTYSIYFKKKCFVRRILRLRILIILSRFCVQKISCYEDKSC